MRERTKAILLILSAALLWASIGLIARFIYSYSIDPLYVVSLRILVATTLLFGGLIIFQPTQVVLRPIDVLKCLFYGFWAIGANFILYFYALKYTKIAIAATLIYTNPIFIMLLKRSFSYTRVIFFLLTLIGIWLLLGAPTSVNLRENWLGVAFALGCAFSIAIYNVLGKRLLKHVPPWPLLAYALLGGCAIVVILSIPLIKSWQFLAWPVWVGIVTLAIGPTILGYGLYLKAIKIIDPVIASMLAMVEPVFASALAWGIFKESINVTQGIGILFILSGAILTQKYSHIKGQ